MKFIVAQSPPTNAPAHWGSSYLWSFDGDGSLGRGWTGDMESAFRFDDRAAAERIAAGIRTTYTSFRGHHIKVREVEQ